MDALEGLGTTALARWRPAGGNVRPLRWHSGLSVEARELDAGYRSVLALAGEVQAAVRAEAPPERLAAMVRRLRQSFKEHLEREQHYLRRLDLPDSALRRSPRRDFWTRLGIFQRQLDAGQDVAPALGRFLRSCAVPEG